MALACARMRVSRLSLPHSTFASARISTRGCKLAAASSGSLVCFVFLGLTYAWQVRKSNKNHTLATAEFQLCDAGVSDQS